MKKEIDLWQFALHELAIDRPVALLIVVESSGSSPGRPGFKMIVAGEELAGSVGGGVMEIGLVERARTLLHQARCDGGRPPQKQILWQVHRKDAAEASGMICSGRQAVLLQVLKPQSIGVVRDIVTRLAQGEKLELTVSESAFGLVEPSEGSANPSFAVDGRGGFIYREKLGFRHRLFIVGGGHCALALSEVMSGLDFYISLFDDRPNLNTVEKNRFAHLKTILDSYESIGEIIPSGADHYVVVMTLGYKFDEIVIRQLLEKKFKYFGVLGSRAKMRTLLRQLAREGYDKQKLAAIRTPIGLPINSHTPEEIAVSIAAEIISVKNSGK
jgi:xanthine dehydrogenase accessory factor